MKTKLVNGVEVHRGSGNVFADLGLVIEIRKAMKAFGLNQQEAAKRMGISQPKVSDMMRGNFTNLSGAQADGLPDTARRRYRNQGASSQITHWTSRASDSLTR